MSKKPAITGLTAETLRWLHATMVRIRRLEEKVAGLLAPEPEIRCPVHLYIGQEAVAAGVCAGLRREDYVLSTHRSHGHYIAKGGGVRELLAELYGRASGCSRGKGGSMHLASPGVGLPGSCAIVAGTVPVAVGAALAFTIQKKDNVSVAFFGDGAANEGVFYESLNFASLKKLPVVFVCENNFYSTHMPVDECLANVDIYKKAEAFCLPGVRVDGSDAIEVYRAAKEAIARARQGRGPTLVECLTYRWRGHVGPSDDLDKGLRTRAELEHWQERCPIRALEKMMLEQGVMSPAEKDRLYQNIDREIEEAITLARESPYPSEGELLTDIFRS